MITPRAILWSTSTGNPQGPRQPAGGSVAQRAKAVGVSRQTFYYWLTGVIRPNDIQAKKLKRLTSYDYDRIRGLA